MEKKFEKLSPAEIGIVAFMVLVLAISLVASWYKDSQTASTTTNQQQVSAVDPNFKAAENAVIELEGNQTKEKLEAAQAAVDKLIDATKKQELQNRINKVKVSANNLTDAQTKAKLEAELVRAEAAKKLEEQKKASSSSTSSSVVPEVQVTEPTETIVEEVPQEVYQDVETYETVTYDEPTSDQQNVTTPDSTASTVVEASGSSVSETATTGTNGYLDANTGNRDSTNNNQ